MFKKNNDKTDVNQEALNECKREYDELIASLKAERDKLVTLNHELYIFKKKLYEMHARLNKDE